MTHGNLLLFLLIIAIKLFFEYLSLYIFYKLLSIQNLFTFNQMLKLKRLLSLRIYFIKQDQCEINESIDSYSYRRPGIFLSGNCPFYLPQMSLAQHFCVPCIMYHLYIQVFVYRQDERGGGEGGELCLMQNHKIKNSPYTFMHC